MHRDALGYLLVGLLLGACGLDTEGGGTAIGGGLAAGSAGTAVGGAAGNAIGGAGAVAGGAAGDSGAPAGGAAGSGGAPSGGAAGAAGVAGGGGVPPDACGGACTDANASCNQGSCVCNPGYRNVDSDNDPKTATCAGALVQSLTVQVGVDTTKLGQLTIKLWGPTAGNVITLMSRPGLVESGDDGSGGDGDNTDLSKDYPITFSDSATPSAESMGSQLFADGAVACKDDGVCAYRPASGSVGGPATLATAFASKNAVGSWTLCVGDSVFDRVATIQNWKIEFQLNGGPLTVNATALGIVVADDGYNGSQGSMACHALTVSG